MCNRVQVWVASDGKKVQVCQQRTALPGAPVGPFDPGPPLTPG